MSVARSVPSLLWSVFASLLMLAASARPGQGKPPPSRMERYGAALATVTRQRPTQGLEPLYRLGRLAEAEVRPVIAAYAEAHWRQPGYDLGGHFAPLLKRLPGFALAAYEGSAIWLGPRLAYWQELAARRGQPSDQRFFALLLRQQPDGQPLPAYLEQKTDYDGCRRYGEGILVGLYRDWRAYQASFPNQYVELVAAQLAAVQSVLLAQTPSSICSCDGQRGYLKELAIFVQELPSDPLAAQLTATARELETASRPRRFDCSYN
jgi:uncharacterized membrane protein